MLYVVLYERMIIFFPYLLKTNTILASKNSTKLRKFKPQNRKIATINFIYEYSEVYL